MAVAGTVGAMASFPGPDPTVPLLARLCCQFPHVDSEVVAAVLESVGGTVVEALGVLCDLQSEALAQPPAEPPASALTVDLRAGASGGGGLPLDMGSVGEVGKAVLRIDVEPSLLAGSDAVQAPDAPTLLLAVPSGELWPLAWHEPPLILRPPAHGWYRLILQAPGGRAEARFHVASVVGEYAEALDDFYDALAWCWDGTQWTEELSDASLNLVVGVDDFMERLGAMLAPVLPIMGGSFRSMLESPRKVLENQLARIIEQHDAQAVGMTHSAVRDLLQQSDTLAMFGPLLGGVTGGGGTSAEAVASFSRAAAAFESARQAASSAAQRRQVREALARLLAAGERYVAQLRGSPQGGSGAGGGLAKQWDVPGGLRSQLQAALEEDGIAALPAVMQLQGGGGGMLADMLGQLTSGMGGGAGSGPPVAAESMSFLDPQVLLQGGREMQSRVAYWSESLISGAVVVGSPMRPMQLSAAPHEVQNSAQALMQLMRLGFGYVVQGDDESSGGRPTGRECTLTGTLHRTRATLLLHAPEAFLSERRRRSRLKDVMRVVRSQAKQGRRFSLRMNTDLEMAVAMLREHHEDNWVGPILESVWGEMFRSGTLVVFELWSVEDGGSEQLVAADFGHPHSTFGFYVATRYFDRSFRTCMPGFILAFAEAQVLAKRGYDFWDLGGTNSSPMMSYKPQVAFEMKKDVFLDELHATHRHEMAAAGSQPESLCAGTLVEAISEDDLWGAALCRESAPQPPPSKKDLQKAKSQAKKQGKQQKPAAAQAAEGGSAPFSPAERAPEAGADAEGPSPATPAAAAAPAAPAPGKPAMQARLKELFTELQEAGMGPQEAAVEAFKRLTLEGGGASLGPRGVAPTPSQGQTSAQ